MTFRSVILGLLAGAIIAGVGYLNRHVGTTSLTRGHLPISVFGLFILAVAFINPLLFKLRRNLRFRPAEFAVIVAMMLVACNIPSAGLMRYFTATIVMPVHMERQEVGWQDTNVLGYAPPSMLVADGKYDETAVGGYMGGLGKRDNPIGLGDIPWAHWEGPLITWLPLIMLCAVAVVCMSLIVHPQWSKRERLRYPIADFATSLLEQDPDRATGSIFRHKGFWLALGVILFIHLVNGLYTWYEAYSIQIKMNFDFTAAFKDKFPVFMNTPRADILTKPMIFPAVIAFGFFLPSDVSFSIGISHFASICAIYLLAQTGRDVSGTYMRGGLVHWHNFGSFVGVALLLGYVGRRYYWAVLKRTVCLGRSREAEGYAVWASRVFFLATFGMIVWLIHFGLDWYLAVLAVLMTLLMFLVMARINAESGLFFYKPPWWVAGVLVGLFGMETLGPGALLIAGLFAVMLAADPFECLIPYVTNGLKITDSVGVRTGRVGIGLIAVFALGLAVVIPVGLWADYNYGLGANVSWINWAPKAPFKAVSYVAKTLKTSGTLEKVEQYTSWERLRHMRPDRDCLWGIAIGFILVVICGKMRLRFPWWPLHPLIFLCFGSFVVGKFGFSFLLGWFIKVMLTRIGGQQKYRQAKPFVIGAIAGDLLGGLIFMVINWVYYLVTALPGKEYKLW